jgi:transcriptional regulator with XRE-family HTH domain
MSPRRHFTTGPAARGFGRMLRERRSELRLTLEKVAELVPCSVQHISEIERGERYASLPSITRIDWALSGSGLLAEWVLMLILEQLTLHHPVYATSRGWEGDEPARNVRGEELDATGIRARVESIVSDLRRHARIGADGSAVATAPPDQALSSASVPVHHGGHERRDAAEAAAPAATGRIDSGPWVRLWLDGRPCAVHLLVADVELADAAAADVTPGAGMERRSFIRIGGLGSLGAAAGVTGGVLRLSSVNPRVLDYLEREAERLPRDFWSGPEEVHFSRVEDAYQLADGYLAELPRLRDQVRLHRITARLAVLRANREVFSGRLGGAERWYRLATERAMEAGDHGLALWALADLAMTRAWTGAAARDILDIVARARHLSGAQPGAATAMLAAVEARAQARVGDRGALTQRLAEAEAELDLAPSSERVASVFGFTDAMRMHEAAVAWVIAGDPRQAEREARQAIALYEPWHRTDLQVVRLHLATALADQGRPDEACAVAREGLPGGAAQPSGWAAHAAAQFDRHLDPYGDTAAVREFRQLGAPT